MNSCGTRSIKCFSIIIILFLLLPAIQVNHQITFFDNHKIEIASNECEKDNNNALTRSTRANDQETEPNNDITTSESNGNKLNSGNVMEGQMTHISDETDFFYLDMLGGGLSNIDRVNITPTFTNKSEIDDKAVGIKLKVYTMFDHDIFLLDYRVLGTNEAPIWDISIPWKNSTSLEFNADHTGRYYLKISAVYIINSGTNQVIDPDVIINYSLQITITSISNPDNNNDPGNGTVLSGPIQNQTISQADDHWDWYKIDSLTINRAVNVTASIKINNAFNTSTQSPGHYVRVIGVLWCFDLDLDSYVKYVAYGDSRELEVQIELYLAARCPIMYLGIHSQQQIFEGNNWVPDAFDCGDSYANYNVESYAVTIVNTNPVLYSWNATPTKGSMADTYNFDIIYQDADNDEPLFVNVTIDNTNYTMSKTTISSIFNDDDYTNGERYEITIPGSSFSGIIHTVFKSLRFYFNTQDYFSELSLPLQYVELTGNNFIYVIDNVQPILREGLPNNWTIKEDSGPVYIDLFKIFIDPDKDSFPDEVEFKFWDKDNDLWMNNVGSDNISVQIKDNDTIELNPLENKFGTDSFLIRATDIEFQLGNLSAILLYEFVVIIEPVNDEPILVQPIDYIKDNETEMKEDNYLNITFEASDATDLNADPILYSIDITEKIPQLGLEPDIYNFQFSNLTGNLSFIPDNDMVGIYTICVTATDQGVIEPVELSITKKFKLEIINVNDAPVARINLPKHNATFNTSSNITLNAINSSDQDVKFGDRLHYHWYLDVETEETKLIYRTEPIIEIPPIKDPGKHTLILKVADNKHALGRANITIWIISLVGDIPGGEDTDVDGMPDIWEHRYNLNTNKDDSNEDPDLDNFTNLEEYLGEDSTPGGLDSSDPFNPSSIPGDIDSDSLPDSWELRLFGTMSQGKNDDPDDDTYTNYEEYLGESDPLSKNSIPKGNQSADDKKDSSGVTVVILILSSIGVVIIILFLLFFLYMKKRIKQKKEEEEKKSDEKKPFYTPEPMPILRYPGPAVTTGTMPVAQPMQTPPPQSMPLTQGPPFIPVAGAGVPLQPQIQPQIQPQPQPQPQSQKLALPPSGEIVAKKEEKPENK